MIGIDNVREDGSVDTDYGDRCAHGTYIGTPGGGDFLCGWCEEGIPWKEYLAYQRQRAHDRMRDALRAELFNRLCDYGLWRYLRNADALRDVVMNLAEEVDALSFEDADKACAEYLGWSKH